MIQSSFSDPPGVRARAGFVSVSEAVSAAGVSFPVACVPRIQRECERTVGGIHHSNEMQVLRNVKPLTSILRICQRDSVFLSALIRFNQHHQLTKDFAQVPFEFDELSYNVLHNQILKATMRRLIRAQDLATESTEGLAHLYRRFSDVEDIELTGRVFGRVQLYRNNQFYDFLLKVCELIYRNLLISEKSGSSKFADFVRDEQQMRILFENFVRTFFPRSHTVKRGDIHWRWTAVDKDAADSLPKMQTDISLSSSTRKIIIDCKFTPKATQHHYEAETLRSSHLFQINAYLTNLSEGKLTDTCEMMLLYPTVDSPFSRDYMDNQHKIKIRTINLWQGIHKDLLALVA